MNEKSCPHCQAVNKVFVTEILITCLVCGDRFFQTDPPDEPKKTVAIKPDGC